MIDRIAEGIGQEETRRMEGINDLRDYVDKVKGDLQKVMDKRKLETDNGFRDLRKEMSKPGGKPAGAGSNGAKSTNQRS